VIDVHAHVVPAELPFGRRPGRWPVLEVSGDAGTLLVDGKPFRRVRAGGWDLDRRVDDMAGDGVEVQVLSPMPELFSYWAPATEGAAFCAEMNNWLAEAVAKGGGRFLGLGVVPLQDPEMAAAMLAQVDELGLRGVEVGSNVEGVAIGDRRFRPFLAEAARRGLCVLVHAFHPPQWSQLRPAVVANAATFPNEIGFAAATLVMGGSVPALPDLRLALSHGGGSFLTMLARLGYAWEGAGEIHGDVPEPPERYARRLYYDTLTFSTEGLELLASAVGPSQVLVGSDYPFVPLPAGSTLAGSGLADDARRAVEVDNARRFLGLEEDPS
jgi:aminocarboxymuconate-semialdehyde decarboxylase